MTELHQLDRDLDRGTALDFDVVGIEHPGGVLSLIAFRRMSPAQQRTYVQQLLGTFEVKLRPTVVEIPAPSLSPDVVRRIEASFLDRGGDMVVCPARRGG